MEFVFREESPSSSSPSKEAIKVFVTGSLNENMMKQHSVSALKGMSKTTFELLTLAKGLTPQKLGNGFT